jgi:beta-lactamase regulating signal transducer with metallopeptidase domain
MTTAALNLNELARISAGRMLNCTLEGIAIGLFAWVLLHIVGRRNASTRFAVWFSALLAIAAMPVFSVAGSGVRVGAGNSASAITVPSSWALVVFGAWAIVAGVALARVGVGLWQLRKLRQSCTAINVAILDPLLQGTLQSFQAFRSVTLCQSDRLQVPTAIGFLKPMIVIPTWAIQELATPELNSILIHELAHLRRWDDWTNLAQQVVKALLFFHPAVWWIEGKLALEREMACDDAVLAETANPRGYAQCLISIAEKSFMRRGLALAQAAVNRVRQTSLRVSQILDVNRSGATQVWKPALYSVAGFSVICLVSLSHAPELVAFEDKAPNTAASEVASSTVPVSATASSLLSRNVVVSAVSMPAKRAGLTTHPSKSVLARRIIPRHDAAKPIEADFNQSRTDNLVQPKPAVFIEDAEAAPQTILVVMQSKQYSQAGPMLWRMCVWRVIVFDPSQISVQTRIPAKRI